MFENILNHPEVVESLTEEIDGKTLPASLLFFGDKYTGKLTAALELARILTCENNGLWSCKCRSCEEHRVLDSPSTVMLGNRYFLEEIEACADILNRHRQLTGQYQFVRSVRKLTRRFDQYIWKGMENKVKGLSGELEKIEAIVELISPGKELPAEKKLAKLTSDALKISTKIADYIGSDNIPINHIRNITYWTHTTFSGRARIVIIEGAGSMGESSRNALLKILEEPPPSVYFILISTRKNLIMPTILSRVRPYNFRSRSNNEDKAIIRRIFRDDSDGYINLRDFFMGMNGVNLTLLRQYSSHALDILINKKAINIDDFSEVLSIIDEKHILRIFLEELLLLLQDRCIANVDTSMVIPLHTLQRWNLLIQETMNNRLSYNQNTRLLFETLLYQMREAV